MDQKVYPLFPTYSGRSSLGAQTVTWHELTYRWARVKYLRGQQMLNVGEQWECDEIAVQMHYTDVVTPRCRLKWQNRKYEIVTLNGTRREGTLNIKARLVDEGLDSAEVAATE